MIGGVLSGLVVIVVSIVYQLLQEYQRQMPCLDQFDTEAVQNGSLSEDDFSTLVENNLDFNYGSPYGIQDATEIGRSFFSGAGKGLNFASLVGNPAKTLGDDGHYHDITAIKILGAVFSLGFAVIFAVRAVARGFGREPAVDRIPLTKVGFFSNKRKPNEDHSEAHKMKFA